jgi:hypothetical protein
MAAPARPKFVFKVPPEAEALFAAAVKEVARSGAKALAAAVGSGVSDARKIVKAADDYLKGVEGRAGDVGRRNDP